MTISLSSPVTGAAQTGFTTPTYTLTVDTAPANGKQWAITALGGTQANVATHTIAKPFTIAYFKGVLKALGIPNIVTGLYRDVPRNKQRFVIRKGVDCALNTPSIAFLRIEVDVPAGADTYEPEELKAMLSLGIGALNQVSAGLGDTTLTGIVG